MYYWESVYSADASLGTKEQAHPLSERESNRYVIYLTKGWHYLEVRVS